MAEGQVPGPPSGGPGSGSDIQRKQVLDVLRHSEEPLTDVQVSEILGIGYSAAGPRLSELFDAGMVEPIKRNKNERQRWQVVPLDRRGEVKEQASQRRKTALLSKVKRQPAWVQGWLIRQLLAVEALGQEKVLQEECPMVAGRGPCTCPTANVWVQRHEKKSKGYSRVRREVARWRNELKEHRDEAARVQREDPPLVQFLKDKGFAREALHLVYHLESRIDDEMEARRNGVGELSDRSVSALRDHVVELAEAIEQLEAKYAIAAGELEGVIDVDIDGEDVPELSEGEIEILDSDGTDPYEILDAEIVD